MFNRNRAGQRTYERQLRIDAYKIAGGSAIALANFGYLIAEGQDGPVDSPARLASMAIAAALMWGPTDRWLHGYNREQYLSNDDIEYARSIERRRLIQESPQGRHLQLVDLEAEELREEDLN